MDNSTPLSSTPTHTTVTRGSLMKNRLFWGTPHTDTDVNNFEAAMRERAEDEAAGKFAAVHAVEKALEGISRRSLGLLQFDALLALVLLLLMLLATQAGTAAPETFAQFIRWGFVLAIVSCVLLLPNLALVWGSDPAAHTRQPRTAYLMLMGVHKMRAARYTFALVFSFCAAVLAVVSLTQMA
jgi:hypothetical protein